MSGRWFAHGRDAVALLGELPVTPERRRLRAEMLLALGTIRWQHAGPGTDFSLRAAFDTLREARAALGDKDATGMRGAIVAAMAGVAAELGDITALDTALGELSEATRVLLAEGAAVEAARLLNDEAALLLRVGDPVQAAWLLERARSVFERQVESMDVEALRQDPTALAELAETDHLYARLPLHAAARPGREADALALGQDHARAALELYERLGDGREAARVRETLARLELRAGHPRRAEELLQEALHAQETLGDVLGLARTAGALAEVAAQAGRFDEALQRLGDSLAFNVDKGSALGVAWNRRALARIADAVRGSGAEETTRAFDALAEQMERAEAIVGPVRLPADEA